MWFLNVEKKNQLCRNKSVVSHAGHFCFWFLIFSNLEEKLYGLVWFAGFYGISTFVGYLTPNPF